MRGFVYIISKFRQFNHFAKTYGNTCVPIPTLVRKFSRTHRSPWLQNLQSAINKCAYRNPFPLFSSSPSILFTIIMAFVGLKSIVAAAAIAQFAGLASAAEYWQSFNSSINPLNITLPDIPQTTSIDPATECTYYNPDPSLFTVDPTQWPTSWDIATSNGMNTSTEFQNFYNSLDWANAPNISVRTLAADGSIDMTGYDSQTDPDCWWTSSTCTVPKLKDVNPDIYECPEPETWGLTYDDGPNCSHNAFYDYLQQQDLKASMFYIGSNVVDWPYGAMRGVRDGHHISSHTWSHRVSSLLSPKCYMVWLKSW